MKTKIITLLMLITLVSCGSDESKKPVKEWFENCAQDQLNGDECDTPPVEPPVAPPVLVQPLVVTDITSLTIDGNILTFRNEKEIDGETNRIFQSEDVKFNAATWMRYKLFIREDGTATYQVMSQKFHFAWTWENTETTWEIVNVNDLLINDVLTAHTIL